MAVRWIKRIKGAAVIGGMWAAAWFLAGMALLFVVGFGAADVPFPLFFGLLGFIAGALCSLLLSMLSIRRRLKSLSVPLFAACGAAGGFLLTAVVGALAGSGIGDGMLTVGPILAAAGALSAAGTVAIAAKSTSLQLESGREQSGQLLDDEQEQSRRDSLGT